MENFNTDIQLTSNDWTTSSTENQWLTDVNQPSSWFGNDPNNHGSYQNQITPLQQTNYQPKSQTAPTQKADWLQINQITPTKAYGQQNKNKPQPKQNKRQKNNQTTLLHQAKRPKHSQVAPSNQLKWSKNNLDCVSKPQHGKVPMRKKNKNQNSNIVVPNKVAYTGDTESANYTNRQKKQRPVVNEENKYYGYFKVEAKALNVYKKHLESTCVQPHDVNALAEEQARFQYYFVVKNFAFAKNHAKKKPPELRQGRGFNCNACDEYFFIKSNLDKHRVSNAHFDIMLLYDGFKKIGEEWFGKFQDPAYELPGWVVKAEMEGIVFETGAEQSQSGRYKLKDVETAPITDEIFEGIDVGMNLDDFILATYDNIMEVHWPRATTNFYCRCCNNISFETEEKLKEHLQSDEHQNYEKNYNSSWCTSCQRHTGSAEALAEHINTPRHSMIRKLLADTRVKAVSYWNRKQKQKSVQQNKPAQGEGLDESEVKDGYDEFIVPVAGFICRLCDVKLATFLDVDNHRKITEHQDKLKAKKAESKNEETAETSDETIDPETKKKSVSTKVTSEVIQSKNHPQVEQRPQVERRRTPNSSATRSSTRKERQERPKASLMDIEFRRDYMRPLVEPDLHHDSYLQSRIDRDQLHRVRLREEQFGRRYDSELEPEFSGYREQRYLPELDGGYYPPAIDEDRYPPRFSIDRYPPRFGYDRYSPRFDEERYPPLSELGYDFPARSELEYERRILQRRMRPIPPILPEDRYEDYPPVARDLF